MAKGGFNEKVVIITGAGQGIGKALAGLMGRRGACLVVNDIDGERLGKTGDELESKGYPVFCFAGDVTRPEDCEALVSSAISRFGKIDILINNAGLSAKGSVGDTQPSVFRALVDVNLLGSFYNTKYALPHIRETRGSIFFVSSLAAINGLPYSSAYSASKMALTALAESLRIELYGTGIHVGIAYVSFTANDPGKKMYNADGTFVPVPERSEYKVKQVEETAALIAAQLEMRKYRVVHSVLGKLNWMLNKVAPGLVEKIKIRSLEKFRY